MYIVISKEQSKEKVLNILYTDDSSDIRKYIMDYLKEKTNSLLMTPIENGIKKLEYSIEEKDERYTLIKSYKKVLPGYVYNTSTKIREIIIEIRSISYDGGVEYNPKAYDALYTEINGEINKRVLKQLDQESLYQIITKIQENINIKNEWTKKEYTSMTNEIIKNFKKELYSSIAKKLKRYGNYGLP